MLSTVVRAATPPTHTQPYNYDWLWILFVIFAVLLIAALVYVRIHLGGVKHHHPEQAAEATTPPGGGPPEAS